MAPAPGTGALPRRWTGAWLARNISHPLHGDIAVWKIGRAYSHGAIVLLWPCIIHAAAAPVSACVLDNARGSALNLGRYPVKFFTAWE